MRFSSDLKPNSDSCDCFLSRAEFQLCRALFVVQCSCSVQGETRSDKSLPTGNRTVGWISDMSEILVAPREGITQLKQSYEATALNSVLFSLTAPARKQYFNHLIFIAARKKTTRGRFLIKCYYHGKCEPLSILQLVIKTNKSQNYKYFSFKPWRRASA